MFEYAIREDDKNPDIYRNYAAHLSGIDNIKKCKKMIQKAQKYAEKDVLLAEFMEKDRLIDLFKLRGKRSEKEAEKLLVELGVNIDTRQSIH